MAWRRTRRLLYLVCALAALAFPSLAAASAYHGQVTFGGLPVPGATVTVTQGTKKLTTVTDQGGLYTFADLADGAWQIEIDMQCFSTVHNEITVSTNTAPAKWELTLLPPDEITKLANLPPAPLPALPAPALVKKPATPGSPGENAAEIPKPAEDASQQSSDGLLVNGSVNNAATSRFSLDQAFGNRRYNTRSLYNGGFAAIYDNSATDARPYSLSGLNLPRPPTIASPACSPSADPSRFRTCCRAGRRSSSVTSGRVTTMPRLRRVLFPPRRSGQATSPVCSTPSANRSSSSIPQPACPSLATLSRSAPRHRRCWLCIPRKTFTETRSTTIKCPFSTAPTRTRCNRAWTKRSGARMRSTASFNFQSTRSSTTNLFAFTDKTSILGINFNVNWSHRFSQRLFVNTGYRFSRLRTNIVPYFENRQNISGEAGISGNNQDPSNWGPPALTFSSGITMLTDENSSFNRNRTDSFSGSISIYRGRHNITIGGDLRKQEYNDFFQANPRGIFTFTGAATQGATGQQQWL